MGPSGFVCTHPQSVSTRVGLTAGVTTSGATAPGPTTEELIGPEAPAHLAALRAQAPASWVASTGGWLVTTHDAALEVMRDHTTYTVDDPRFSTALVVGPSMLSLDGADHLRHRRPFVSAFRPSRVEERYGESTRALATALLDRVRGDGVADLRTTLAGPLSVEVMARTLGLAEVDAPTVLAWYAAIVGAVSELSAGGEAGPEAAEAVAALSAHLGLGIRDDSVLAGARGSLEDREVIANAAVMLFGGIETTEGMICSALAHLLAAPEALSDVRAEPALVAAVVEESLRLEPAAAVVDRYATRDVELRGARIRRGDLVRVSISAANRDPAVFADPDRFDPRRPRLREQLAFARGPHVCLAMDLARLEARAAVTAVLELPGVRLERAEPATGLVFRKPDAVVATWEAATSAPAR